MMYSRIHRVKASMVSIRSWHFFAGFLFFIISLCTLLSWITFCATDPSLFYQSSDGGPVQNMLGVPGAFYTSVLFFLFGSSSFVAIIMFFFTSYVFLFSRSWRFYFLKMTELLLFMTVCASLGTFYGVRFMGHLFMPGGTVGFFVSRFLFKYLDVMVEGVFLHVCALALSLVIFQIPFATFVQSISMVLSYSLYVIRKTIEFLQPIILAAFAGLKKVTVLTFAGYRKIKYLLDGSVVYNSGKSVVEFEFDSMVYDEFKELSDQSVQEPEPEPLVNSADLETVVVPVASEEKPRRSFLERKFLKKTEEKQYLLPPVTIFVRSDKQYQQMMDKEEQKKLAETLEEKLEHFGIAGHVVSIKSGPVITLFEYKPSIDSKISKIIALEDDLALALQATSIRIIAPIPGKPVVGFEVANKERYMVKLSTVIHSSEFKQCTAKLPLILGVDTVGDEVIVDLATMPHLLVAGATGSGKSVALNAMLTSLLYKFKPDDLKLILIDPKRLEFAPYSDIAHLLFPIVTNPKLAGDVLQWVVRCMEQRYEKMAEVGVRSVADYNTLAAKNNEYEKMPFIVVMIDELADLMMVAGKEIEEYIARIAQMARAAGIHMIVATQRPSVDVITGVIKANFPSRISFKVATKIDSRTILDTPGADGLLGNGDMLYLDTKSRIHRVHGAFVSDHEVEELTKFIRSMQPVSYLDLSEEIPAKSELLLDGDEELYKQVVEFVQSVDEVSISLLQRKFRIGYNRSARIIDMLESEGFIMPSHGGKTRKVIH